MREFVEKGGFFGGDKFVSTYRVRDKKNYEKWIFGLEYLRR